MRLRLLSIPVATSLVLTLWLYFSGIKGAAILDARTQTTLPSRDRSNQLSKTNGNSSMVNAADYPGADDCSKIENAFGALNTSSTAGGVVDARSFGGVATCSAGFTLGSSTASDTLLLGNVQLWIGAPVIVEGSSSIIGLGPRLTGIGANGPMDAVVQVGTTTVYAYEPVLSALHIDANNTATFAVEVVNGGRIYLSLLEVYNAVSDGVHIDAPASGGNNCCGHWEGGVDLSNGNDGIYATGTTDWFISNVEFENNSANGIELFNTGGFRIMHSDFGGNGQDGFKASATPNFVRGGSHIIIGNQFDNAQNDIELGERGQYWESGFNTISDNSFIGGNKAPGTYFNIVSYGNLGNNISGNSFQWQAAQAPKYSIDVSNDGGRDMISGNFFYDQNGGETGDINIGPLGYASDNVSQQVGLMP